MLFGRNDSITRVCHSSRFRAKKQARSDLQSVDRPAVGAVHVTPASTRASPQIFNAQRRFPPPVGNNGLTSLRASQFKWIAFMSFLAVLSLLHFAHPSGPPALLPASASPNPYTAQTRIVASRIIQQSYRILHRKTPVNTQPIPHSSYDYALWSNGGVVLSSLTSPHGYDSWVNRLMGKIGSVQAVLEDDLREGACWRLPNRLGQIAIAFQDVVRVTHVMVDHIPAELTNAIEIAPRKLLLWGMVDGEDNLAKYHSLRSGATGPLRDLLTARMAPALSRGMPFVPLVSFDYNIHAANHTQLFPILDSVVAAGMDFGVVVLEILDNWDGEVTCLYRVGIYGERRT